MKLILSFSISLLMVATTSCQSPPASNSEEKSEKKIGGSCECCEAWKEGIPKNIGWQTKISPDGEQGEALEISGTIYHSDEKTPAEGIILYVYHTDSNGKYSRGPDYSECSNRHGLLRGWVKTGKDGRFKFQTIRPASYPNTEFEQHIHPIIKEPGYEAYWIDAFVFEDDPKLTEKVRNRCSKRGGNGIVVLTKNEDDTWVGQRDIILGKNVNGY